MSESGHHNNNDLSSINDLINKINETNAYHEEKEINNEYLKQINRNQKTNLIDDKLDIKSHKEIINDQIIKELKFKRKARFWSIILFSIISVIIVSNLALLLYWNPINLSDKVLIVMTTVTFANLFAIIAVIFKYLFSSTKEMLDYNSSFYNHEEE